MMKCKTIFILCTLMASAFVSIITSAGKASYEGALTEFLLSSSAEGVGNDYITVLDLDINTDNEVGHWHIYIEGTSTSKDGRVTSTYDEALADAGGAADGEGKGRLQISNFEYIHPFINGELIVGLVYPSGFAETGEWSNDETGQFLSSPFVNIQTIGAPDYAMGVGYVREISNTMGISVLLSQGEGLGDMDGSYNKLISETDGVFFSTEMSWSTEVVDIKAGFWMNTVKQETLDPGDDETGENRGVNISAQVGLGPGKLLLRYGIADDEVSEAASFIGLSYQLEMNKWRVGLGHAVTGVASIYEENGAKDSTTTELYIQYELSSHLGATLSYQALDESGFGVVNDVEPSPSILALRLSYGF